MKIRLFIFFMILFLPVLFLKSQTITVPCAADAAVCQNDACPWQSANYGTTTYLPVNTWTWYGPGCGPGMMRSILQFNFVNPGPHQLYDNRALLKLYYPTGSTETHNYTGSATDNQFYIQRVTAPWAEMTVTWDNQPAATATGQILVPSASTNPSTEDYVIDVSTMVLGWVCNTVPNQGMLLKLVNEGQIYRRVTFTSREYAVDITRRPKLELQYAYIAATGPDTICEGDPLSISCSLNNANNPSVYQFHWTHLESGTTYNTQNVANPAHLLGLNTYVVQVSNPWCPTASDTVTVFEIEKPEPIASYNSPLCEGDTLFLAVSPADLIHWTGPNGFVSNQQNPVILNMDSTHIGLYTVTLSNGFGCDSTVSLNVTFTTIHVTATANPSTICSGQSSTLTASGALNYLWNTGITDSTYTVNPTTSTIYSVTGTSLTGCSSSDTVVLTVNPVPVLTVSASPSSICSGQGSLLTANGASTYLWDTGATGPSVTVGPLTTTTYTVTGTSTAGCTSTATVNVTVIPSLFVTAVASPASICSGQSSLLTADGGTTYTWNTGAAGPSITVIPQNTTTYTVTGTTNGCTGTASLTVNVIPTPDIITSVIHASCGLDNGSATVENPGSGYTYVWSTDPPQYTQTATGLFAGTYSVTVDNSGCPDTASVTVLDRPRPDADFYTRPEYIIIGETPVFFYDQSIGDITNCYWDFGDGSVGTGRQTSHEYADTGSYIIMLIVSDANGCLDTTRGYIYVYPQFVLWIPNSFTPDLDGNNEVFKPLGDGYYTKDYFMAIYDRWGRELFYTTNFDEGWGGTINNRQDNAVEVQGTYVYLINIRDRGGKKYSYKGTVTLIR